MWCHLLLGPKPIFLKGFKKLVKMGGDYLHGSSDFGRVGVQGRGTWKAKTLEVWRENSWLWDVTSDWKDDCEKVLEQCFCISNSLDVLWTNDSKQVNFLFKFPTSLFYTVKG